MEEKSHLMRAHISHLTHQLLKVLIVSFLALSVFGCKKISYDLTKNDASDDAPEYSVEFDQNLSPAEEGRRKP